MKSLIVISVCILSCVFSFKLNAQETYVWVSYNNDNDPGHVRAYYRMYKIDIINGNQTFLFQIDSAAFKEANVTGFGNQIKSFSFNKDKTEVYFIETEGCIFKYIISKDSMGFLGDLTPAVSPVLVHAYTQTRQIDLVNDSLLYIAGQTVGWYNIKTNTFSQIRQIANHALQFTPFEESISKVKHIYYKDKWIFINVDRNIMTASLDDPENVSLIQNYGVSKIPSSSDILYYQYECDSSNLLIIDYNILDFTISKLNINEATLSNIYSHPILFSEPGYSFAVWDAQHYNKTSFEDCQRYIDLDDNDNTALEKNFLIDSLCSFTLLPLSDIDIKVRNEYPLDSIDVMIEDDNTSNISIPNGNYQINIINGNLIRLINNGTTSNLQFEAAIRNASLAIGNIALKQEVKVKFTAWYDSLPGKTAVATYLLATPLPSSGNDIAYNYCLNNVQGSLELLPSAEADSGGRFYDKSYNEIIAVPIFSTEDSLNLFYITNNGICYDTATIDMYIHSLPHLTTINDTVICYDQNLEINLSTISDEVLWNDGSNEKVRTFFSSSSYNYTIKNEYDCEGSDSFLLTILPPPISKPIEAQVCEGDKFIFLDKEYRLAGSFQDTISNSLLCDSVIYNIGLSFFEKEAIEIAGDFDFCEGSYVALQVTSDHTDIIIDGTSTDRNIIIEESGSYLIQAKDKNDCLAEKEITISSYPSPKVSTLDLIDTVFTDPLVLPVEYLGNITSYSWNPSQSLDCGDCASPSLIVKQEGIYQIIVKNEIGCSNTSEVKVSFKETQLYFPNALLPGSNNQQYNTFYAKGNDKLMYSLSIYDRWGNKVYVGENLEVNNADQGWKPDGSLVTGVYVYVIKYKEGNSEKYMTGDVTLIK